MSKPIIYIAGPYAKPDPVLNTHNTVKFATDLYEQGFCVPVVPHLSLLWHAITPRPHEYWLEYDLHIMHACDAVFRLPGESTGADGEVASANETGMRVFDNVDALKAWCEAFIALGQ